MDNGFDLFDSYIFQRNKKKIKFNGVEFGRYDDLVSFYNAETEKNRNYGLVQPYIVKCSSNYPNFGNSTQNNC